MHPTPRPSNRIFTRRKSLSRIAAERPSLDQDERAQIIGHPEGGRLSFSIDNNLLPGYDGRGGLYRAPTLGSSSGWPVGSKRLFPGCRFWCCWTGSILTARSLHSAAATTGSL